MSKRAEAMRRRWADPEQRAELCERLREARRGGRVAYLKERRGGGAFEQRQVSCYFDDETFEVIRKLALEHDCSLAEAVRTFVEAGIESFDDARNLP